MSRFIKSFFKTNLPDPYSNGGNNKPKWWENNWVLIAGFVLFGITCYFILYWIVNSK